MISSGAPEGMEPPAAGAAAADIRLAWGSATDRGLRRELNEDAFIAADPLFAVADGMGGHEAGEVASRECIQVLGTAAELAPGTRHATAADLLRAVREADARIRAKANSRAGTTVSGVVLTEAAGVAQWLVFNVGDSRTYRLGAGGLAQVSIDHSEVQELVDAGYITPDEALVHPRRHVITRALGTGGDSDPDFWTMPVHAGDRILVCSDGLTGEVGDGQIGRILASVHDPQDAAEALVAAAVAAGGRDNITVIVVDAATTPAAGDGPDHPPTAEATNGGSAHA
ncbi:PP2C family protein-serine/threonine phosphatase [Pseudarthrobacter sp. P1]|uniref:PP2C family protein-serine/threonine phosphatase n=1 Tax=Pseudarthrobacter sp. P1 TaxID=3418418 RepID=UPI003CECCB69